MLLIRRAFAVCTIALLALIVPQAVHSQDAASTWVTLGTMGGAIPGATRSQPAHLLIAGNQDILIDCGDGTAEQLAKAGVPLARIHTIFISHLHFDHIGGLFGVLGLRFQIGAPGPVTIYGPPGTKATVDGLIAAEEPFADVGAGFPGAPRREPRAAVNVIEITGGQTVDVDGAHVSAVANTHYSYPAGSPEAARFQSLSYRFDVPGRSIVYTGDTGPSAAVEKLAQNADLLVSEVVNVDQELAAMKRINPAIDADRLAVFARHLQQQHLEPAQVGLLASRAGVKKVVLVHNNLTPDGTTQVIAIVHETYHGPVVEAHDLDRF